MENQQNYSIQSFQNPQFGTIRGVEVDGEPWLVGKDVAVALGYKNYRDAFRKHVDAEDKGVAKCDTLGGKQELAIISESGLYSLILGSKMPQAKAFKHWVTAEVLPSIRKHGAYATPETIENIINNPDFGIKLLQALKSEREEKERLQEQAQINAPKVALADAIASADNTILIGQFAKILTQHGYKIGQNQLFAWLRDNGYLSSQSGQSWNMPNQQYVNQGLFAIRETTVTNKDGAKTIHVTPRMTGKGEQYFFSFFFDNDGQPIQKPVERKHRKKV